MIMLAAQLSRFLDRNQVCEFFLDRMYSILEYESPYRIWNIFITHHTVVETLDFRQFLAISMTTSKAAQ
jgi:hypothetical protein